MIYTYTSCEPVIADLLSKCKFSDTTYADDLLEWLVQGINMIRVKKMLVPAIHKIEVSSNVGKLPCGLVSIEGFEYQGKRLRKGTGVIDSRICKGYTKPDAQGYFATDPTDPAYQNGQEYQLLRGQDLKMVTECHTTAYYIPYPNHIQTSFVEGCVWVFFNKMPVDDRGYPLIPDEENTKHGLFWWLMAQVTLGGYKHADPKMDYDYCEGKFKEYTKIGRRIISAWSTDQYETVANLTVNLIPPRGYYESFMRGAEQPRQFGGV